MNKQEVVNLLLHSENPFSCQAFNRDGLMMFAAYNWAKTDLITYLSGLRGVCDIYGCVEHYYHQVSNKALEASNSLNQQMCYSAASQLASDLMDSIA